MINLNKLHGFYDPKSVKDPIHIIGVGAMGSCVAELLVRLGFENLVIYDFDIVTAHNITNQMYYEDQINQPKCEALTQSLQKINKDVTVTRFEKGWHGQPLAGYIFLCVDSIALRKEIVQKNAFNPNIKAFFDFRMRLEDAQHYAASTREEINKLLKTMDFTDDEAKEATPVSACGTSLSVATTVRNVVSLGVTNFMNVTQGKPLKTMVLINPFEFMLDAF